MQIICSHENLDFDGLAAMVGAHKLYPKARMVLPHQLSPPVKAYLALYRDVFNFYRAGHFRDQIHRVETVILVDIHQLHRVELARRCVEKGPASSFTTTTAAGRGNCRPGRVRLNRWEPPVP